MYSNRVRGIINLHVLTVTAIAIVLFYLGSLLLPLNTGLKLTPYLLCIAVGMLLSVRMISRLSVRYHRLSWVDAVHLSSQQLALVALVIFTFMFAFKDREMSRLFVGTFLLISLPLLSAINRHLPNALSRLAFEKHHRMPTLLIGGQQGVDRLREWLASCEFLGLRPIGILSSDGNSAGGPGVPRLGDIGELGGIIRRFEVAQVVALEIPHSREEGSYLIDTCQEAGCRLLIYSNLAEQLRHPLVTVTEQGHQFYSLQQEPLEDPLNRLMKRVLDLAISIPVVLLILPPLMLVVAVLHLVQARGPLFFRQERTGYGQKPFRIFKFRTMRTSTGEREAVQARRQDDRIFPAGRFLRRTSLDEIPQFLNVLLGDMSVVGPRPHMLIHDEQFSGFMKAYRTRFFARPGITGLAQCSGFRGEITDPKLLKQRVAFDINYVSQWSIWLDVQLVLKTAWFVLRPPPSAY